MCDVVVVVVEAVVAVVAVIVAVAGDATCKKDNKDNKKQYVGMKPCTFFSLLVQRTQTGSRIGRHAIRATKQWDVDWAYRSSLCC